MTLGGVVRLVRRVLGGGSSRGVTHSWNNEDYQAVPVPAAIADPWAPPVPAPVLRSDAVPTAQRIDLPSPPQMFPRPAAPIDVWPDVPPAAAPPKGSEQDSEPFQPVAPLPASLDWAESLVPEPPPPAATEPVAPPGPACDPALERARDRAGRIAARLAVTSRDETDAVLAWLLPFFVDQAHPSTFIALLRQSDQPLDAETLRAMIGLREHWAERPDLWVMRSARGARGFAILRADKGAPQMTWTLARAVCAARDHLPVEDMIDETWLREWHDLPQGAAGYWRFIDHVRLEIDQLRDRALSDGMQAMSLHWGSSDSAPFRSQLRLADPAGGAPILLPTSAPCRADTHGPRSRLATDPAPCPTTN